MSYYKDIIFEVDQLFKQGEFKKAKKILELELEQAFIPRKYQEQFDLLMLEITEKLSTDENDFENILQQSSCDESELKKLLFSDMEAQLVAINCLRTLNLRQFDDLLQEYFLSDQEDILKGMLLEACVEQELSQKYQYKTKDFQLEVIPKDLHYLNELESTEFLFQELEKIFYKYPTDLENAQSLLVEHLYSAYPSFLDEDSQQLIISKIKSQLGFERL